MNYAAIMVYVDTSNYVAARINLACDIAAISGARVIGISASVPTPPVTASLRFGGEPARRFPCNKTTRKPT